MGEITCDICGKHFHSVTAMKCHMLKHSKLIQCADCDKSYTNYFKFRNHLRRSHVKKTFSVCYICKRLFHENRKGLFDHFFFFHLNIKPPFKCDLCKALENSVEAYVTHMMKHKCYFKECKTCGRKFANNDAQIKHPCNRKEKRCDVCKIILKGKTRHHCKQRRCLDCGEDYGGREHVYNHECEFYRCDSCGLTFQRLSARDFHDCLQWKCKYCDLVLEDREMFQAHDCPLCCRICGTGFLEVEQRDLHQCEDVETFVVCPNCYCIFSDSNTYNTHFRNFHVLNIDPKLLTCEICNRTFEKPDERIYHKCPEFYNRYTYGKYTEQNIPKVRNMRSSSKIQESGVIPKLEGPVKCDICDSVFMNRHILNQHLKKYHKPPSCDICDAVFSNNQELDEHFRNEHNLENAVPSTSRGPN